MTSYGLISKGNGEVILTKEKHTSLSAGGGQAGQGYPCILEPIGVDLYNQSTTGEVSKTLNAIKSDSDHVPCVIEPIIFTPDTYMKIDNGGA